MSLKYPRKKTLILFLCVLILSAFFAGCEKSQKKSETVKRDEFSIAVFVPGITEGSPIYEMLVAGTRKAAEESQGVKVDVIEGGFNQAEWQEKVTSLAATKSYDLIISSNPAMPDICAAVAKDFSHQKFAVMDGYLKDHPQIFTLLFNQKEQAFLIGYMGGLATKSELPGANPDLKVGMVVGQQYPVMDKAIRPGFEIGLQQVDPKIKLDFRVIGNWYDANKAADLAGSIFDAGSDVILAIAGGANQGILKTAKERGKYVLWFDTNGYAMAPGTIIGCTILRNDKAAYETVRLAIEGKLPFGTAKQVGVREGYIDFITDDKLFIENVPLPIRETMESRVQAFKTGEVHYPMPDF